MEALVLTGVRVHNLKDLDLRIPHHTLVVVTGPSGSGKSSLAFDTIYTEGQRRYTESLNPYVRQFLERMEKPDLDSASGITPAVAVGRTQLPRSSRSTVATMTELADVLRLLFARLGVVFCPNCGEAILPDHPGRATELIQGRLEAEEGPLIVAAPLPAAPDEREAEARLRSLLEEGYVRVLLEGEVVRLDPGDQGAERVRGALQEERPVPEQAAVVVDRLTSSAGRSRIREAVENAYREGHGRMLLQDPRGGRSVHTEGFTCSRCFIEAPDPEPHLFSFNSPFGACPECEGFGAVIRYLPEMVVPDPTRTLAEGAIEPFTKPAYRRWQRRLEEEAAGGEVRLDVPWEELTEEEQGKVWDGFGRYRGVAGFWARLEKKKYKMHVRVFMARYRSYVPCPACGGSRLRPEAGWVSLGGEDIGSVMAMTVSEARAWVRGLELSGERQTVYEAILRQAEDRLGYLEEVGVEYLTLDRLSRTLSGGEAQRIGLASVLGASLVDTTYVLDEPTVGLHPRDVQRLIRIVKRLRDRGNTVIVVEHDRAFIEASDMVVDLGPGSGQRGGEVVYQGAVHGLLHEADSATSRYLQGRTGPLRPPRRRQPEGGWIVLRGVREHNLKEIDVKVPRGLLTCVTGVSGSGKSTLVYEVLKPALETALGLDPDRRPGAHDRLEGVEGLGGLESLDQGPLTANRRSNAATYTKAWDGIRKAFAATDAAAERGLDAGSFSFNTKGGRCPECKGEGTVSVDMQFMADVTLRCEQCDGRRFTDRVLGVRYRGRDIADVLDLTVDQAVAFFSNHRSVVRALEPLQRVGLGYLKLGQPAPTLSGGEAQRLKLASHLGRRGRKELVFLFDEPTTGLHGTEVGRLAECLEDLVEQGHTVVVIEHNMDMVSRADWVIDLGPEGGEEGGEVVSTGPPEDVAETRGSHTGKALREALERLPGHRGTGRGDEA
ncbi:MAG: excinuclease ABC subunit UvrA [bacterium]